MLESVTRQSRPPDEVIVADDGSDRETAAVVASWQSRAPVPLVHCWQEDVGRRVARVRNLALARAQSDYLLFLDGDQILHRHFVGDHLGVARRGFVVRGSRAFLSPARSAEAIDGTLPRWWQAGVDKHAAALRISLLSRLLIDWRPRGVEGHNIACWREDALAVNGFEEQYQDWGREDDDFVARLVHLGRSKRRIRFGGIIYHLDHPLAKVGTGNEARYQEVLRTQRIRAIVGLEPHLRREGG